MKRREFIMGWTLIDSSYKDYTAAQIAIKINKERQTNFSTLAAAFASVAIGFLTHDFFNQHVLDIKKSVKSILAAIGIIISIDSAANALLNNYDSAQLEPILETINNQGGKVRIYTEVYEYSTGSGNSQTWKTETIYEYIG